MSKHSRSIQYRSYLRVLISLAVLLIFIPAELSAQEKDFQSLIAEAKTAYDSGDFDTAVDRLLAANRVQPNSRLLLNVARSYSKAGDCVSSAAYYRAFTSAENAEPELVETALEESEALECDAYDPSASGRVLFTSTPAGAAVELNGEEIGTTPFEAVQLPTGSQTFTFSLEGYETLDLEASPQSEDTVEVSATLSEEVTEPEPEVVEEIVTPKSPEDDDTMLYVAGGIAGVGAALVVVGLIYDLSVIPATDEARDETVFGSPEYQSLTDERASEATIATVSYIAGVVLLVGGGSWLTYMLLTDSDSEEGDRSNTINEKMGVAPQLGRDSIGLGVFGTF